MSEEVTRALVAQGVFKGFDGLEGLAECQEFWDDQPYGTRLYYGPGGGQYLHRSVLLAAIAALKANTHPTPASREP